MLDHGMLNIPLSKRGNIDTQIDQYKAQQEAAAQKAQAAAASDKKALKAQAKEILAVLLDNKELMAEKATKMGIKKAELVAVLKDWAKWEPAKILRAKQDWLKN